MLFTGFAIGLAYKPFLEYKKGATLVKQAMNIPVINGNGTMLSINQAILRNIFEIAFRILSFMVPLTIYNSAGFSSIHTNEEFVRMQGTVMNYTLYLVFYFLIFIVEIILVLSDKKRRALHDRIGGPFVVNNSLLIQPRKLSGGWLVNTE